MTQDDPHLKDTARSQGDGASIVQSAWEPTERSRESGDEGESGEPGSITKTRSREVIYIDADEEESRYDIPRKKRRRSKEGIEAEAMFTGDEGEVIVIESESDEGGQVKIKRKRAFWASKAGTATAAVAGLGTDSVA